jgi:hypothetical protein
LELPGVLGRSVIVFKRHAVIYLTLVIFAASVTSLQSLPAHRRTFPLRCGQHSRCHCRSVTHLISSGELLRNPTATRDTEGVQKITGYLPDNDGLKHALTGADICIVPAGLPRRFPLSPATATGSFLREGYRQTWNDPRRPLQDQRWYRQGLD